MLASQVTENIHAVVTGCLQSLLAMSKNYQGPSRQLILGYSGGLDSRVLLQVLHELQSVWQTDFEFTAVYVNHGLQKEANDWQQHCKQTAESLGIRFISAAVSIEKNTSESLEELARNARYEVFQGHLKKGDVLCLAHHQEDQAETVLLRLLRGSGPLGLSGMRANSARGDFIVLRPMLSLPKQWLESYAREHQLQWIEDPSNTETEYDRNYLRHQVMPVLEQRWPNVSKRLARSAELSAESARLLDSLAEIDLAVAGHDLEASLLTKKLVLNIARLQSLDTDRCLNLLRFWLRSLGLALPSRANLQRVPSEVLSAAEDSDPCVLWSGVEIRRFKNHLYAMPPLPEESTEQVYSWNLQGSLVLADGLGELHSTITATTSTSTSTSTPATAESQCLRQPQAGEQVTVRFRQGGERCKPVGRTGSQTLKKLFQEYAVPPWERNRLPLIYYNDQLAAVVGKWICHGYNAQAGETGYQLRWLVNV